MKVKIVKNITMRSQLCLPLSLLFLACGVLTSAQNAEEIRVVVKEGSPLTVECSLRVEHRAEWRLGGRPVPADMRVLGETASGGRLTAKLHASSARQHHAGVYTCSEQPVQRVRVLVETAPQTSSPDSSTIAPVTEPTQELVNYEALKYIVGRPFNLNCTLAVPLDSFEIVWKKNSVPLGEVAGLKERYELQNKGLTFQIKGRSNEDDYGNYTCGLKNQTGHIKAWMVTGNVHAKMTKDANVVEGQNIKITCKLIGKPYSEVTWKYKKDELDNGTDVSAVLGSRVQLEKNEQGLDNTVLVLQNAERADAGLYQCSPAGGTPADVTLRVKGVYDALWPFLGICAEVVVLCAVILFYEKRRTKPELDDSDTDNHDQKKS